MIRFISHLLKLNFEPCKSCEVLKSQLEICNAEKRELLETLVSIVKPQPVPANPIVSEQVNTKSMSFSKRKALLEEQERDAARKRVNSPFIAREDKITFVKPLEAEEPKDKINQEIDKLEQELAIGEANG